MPVPSITLVGSAGLLAGSHPGVMQLANDLETRPSLSAALSPTPADGCRRAPPTEPGSRRLRVENPLVNLWLTSTTK